MESAISFFCLISWPLFSWSQILSWKHEWNTFGGEDLLNLESSSLSKTLLFLAPASLSAEAYILSVGDFSLAATWTEKLVVPIFLLFTCLWGEELDWPPFSQFLISLFVPSSSFSFSVSKMLSRFFFLLSPFSTSDVSPLVCSFTITTSSSSKVGASKGNLEKEVLPEQQIFQMSLHSRFKGHLQYWLMANFSASWLASMKYICGFLEWKYRWRWRKLNYLTCLSRAWLRTSRASWATCEQVSGFE